MFMKQKLEKKKTGNDYSMLVEKYPELKDYLENAKQVVDQPLDEVTNDKNTLDLYALHHSSFPWDTLVVFLLKLQDNLKPC